MNKQKLVKPSEAEETAEEIATETPERAENFTFSKCLIPVGAKLEFCNGIFSVFCMVVDDRKVEYHGKKMYLASLAKLLIGRKTPIAGSRYFKYNGEWLNEIGYRLDV